PRGEEVGIHRVGDAVLRRSRRCRAGRGSAGEEEERRHLQLRRPRRGVRLHRHRRQPPEYVSLHAGALPAARERQARDGGGVEDRGIGDGCHQLKQNDEKQRRTTKDTKRRKTRKGFFFSRVSFVAFELVVGAAKYHRNIEEAGEKRRVLFVTFVFSCLSWFPGLPG